MTDVVISYTTINTEKDARKLGNQLVEERLAACVNILPKIRSIYEWDGEVHDEHEFMLIIKSPRDKLDLVKGFIEKRHSYEVPEFISVDVIDGLPDYLQWVKDVTS
jgi:periplasmic divalent cation tolerance protein